MHEGIAKNDSGRSIRVTSSSWTLPINRQETLDFLTRRLARVTKCVAVIAINRPDGKTPPTQYLPKRPMISSLAGSSRNSRQVFSLAASSGLAGRGPRACEFPVCSPPSCRPTRWPHRTNRLACNKYGREASSGGRLHSTTKPPRGDPGDVRYEGIRIVLRAPQCLRVGGSVERLAPIGHPGRNRQDRVVGLVTQLLDTTFVGHDSSARNLRRQKRQRNVLVVLLGDVAVVDVHVVRIAGRRVCRAGVLVDE